MIDHSAMVARNHYTVREIYRITVLAARTTWATRHSPCDRQAAERIMLAVTEVNGCALCSYAHARLALQMGLSDEEVRGLLSGATDEVPSGELAGIAFGQHYADSKGRPDPQAWSDLVARSGRSDALCALRATRMMMWGNATGIPLSSLRSRLHGKPDPRSSVAYEVLTTVGAAAIVPVALLQAAALEILRRPIEPQS